VAPPCRGLAQKSKSHLHYLLELTVMELRHLEYFVAVVDEASFTKAAARLHVAQPGVSSQIRQLERELSQELLDRTGRTVAVTQAGAALLPFARAALEAVAGAAEAVEEVSGLVRGRVAVGMVTACGSLDVPKILAGFHRDHPMVEITLSEANSTDLIDSVRTGRIDLAWVGLAGEPPAGIERQVVIDELLVAAVSHRDPLAKRSTIRLSELGERPLISMPAGTGLRSCLDAACASAGVTPRIAFEAAAPHIIATLAAQGLGIAILPTSVAQAHRDDLHTLAVKAPQFRSRIEVAWRAEGHVSPAARALIRHARQVLTDSVNAAAPAA
jgi:DNA-binding transcriptional LysR family regulator